MQVKNCNSHLQNYKLQTANCNSHLQITNCKLQTANCKLQTAILILFTNCKTATFILLTNYILYIYLFTYFLLYYLLFVICLFFFLLIYSYFIHIINMQLLTCFKYVNYKLLTTIFILF